MDERCLVVAGRRLGEVLLRLYLMKGKLVPFLQLRELHILFLFVLHPGIDYREAGEGLDRADCPTEIFLASRNGYGQSVIDSRSHLTGYKPLPDKPVQLELVGGQVFLYSLRSIVHIRRTDSLMGILCILIGAVEIRLCRYEIVSVFPADEIPDCIERYPGKTGGIGTHIGDKTDRAGADANTFIKLLGNHHGLAGGEAQLAGGILLQTAGIEGRSRLAKGSTLLDFIHQKLVRVLLQLRLYLHSGLFVGDDRSPAFVMLFIQTLAVYRVERRSKKR